MSEPSGPLEEFRRSWRVVAASALGIGLGLSPVPIYTTGMFAPELARSFHWGMGQIQLSLLITTIVVILTSVPLGLLADRLGVRRVALASVVLFSLSFMSLSFTNGSLTRFYLTWAVVALLGSGTLPTTWTRAVNNQFEKGKGTALALSLLGTGVFAFLIKPFAAAVIGHFGWRTAYVVIGALPLLLAFPAGLAWFRDVDGRHPVSRTEMAVRRAATPGLTLGQAIASWRFWVLVAAVVPISFAVAGPIPNLEMILKLDGFAPGQVVSLSQLVGLSVIGGRLVTGVLLDRFWGPAVACGVMGASAASYWLIGQSGLSYSTAAVSIVLMGLAAGAEFDLLAFLVARYFGMKSYSAIYGSIYIAFGVGAGVAPAIFGRTFDMTRSFTLALDAAGVLMALGALMMLALGRYPGHGSPTVTDVIAQAEMTADATPV